MLVEIRVPEDMWPTRSWRATVVSVLVGPGDCVSSGDVVAEVEVDKAVMEVQAGVRGRVVKVLVRPGDVVGPGTVLVVVKPGC